MNPLTLYLLIFTHQQEAIQEQIVQPRLPVNQERQLSIPEMIKQEGELAGLQAWEIDRLIAIAKCESGFREDARNGQYLGIYQMGKHEFATYGTGDPLNARDNVKAAINLYLRRSFQPWQCKG